ncbi:MAG: leucine-rich repeat protein, partial [Eubacteriales bacterium]|nr:leucine-rich repeat protein [Eubacteriales bacterium]
MKKVLSVVLSLVMLAAVLPAFELTAMAADEVVGFLQFNSDHTQPVFGESIKSPTITFDVDSSDVDTGVSVDNVSWQMMSGSEWTEDYSVTEFSEGTWRLAMTISLDMNGYALSQDETLIAVNEDVWTVISASNVALVAVSDEYTVSGVSHNWASVYTVDSEPTCTANGEKSIHCLDPGCTERKDITPIPTEGHSFSHGKCSKCGAERKGDCGDDATWFYDNTDCILYITGTGNMKLIGAENTYTESTKEIVKSVIIGDGITSVCSNAFSDFTALTSVTVPASVTNIGSNAFSGCTALTRVDIADGVTRIGASAFQSCSKLADITIPSTVTSIGGNAFQDCVALKSIVVPDSVTSIGTTAFKGCTSLSSVVLNKGITFIPANAFENCSALLKIEIPDGVTYIQAYAFSGCTKLLSIVVPGTVKQIGYKAFNNCKVLTAVEFCGCKDAYDNISYAASDIGGNVGIIIGDGNDKFKNAKTTYGDHDITIDEVTKEPTCGASGTMVHKCRFCSAVITTNTIPATGKHNYKKYTTPATTQASGKTYEKCTVCGRTRNTVTIAKISGVKLSGTSYTYDGKVKTPSVTVKNVNGKTLVKNTDYTVSYPSGRKNVGKYAVKITFKGKYSGTKTLYFTIKPKSTSISSLKAGSKKFTVKWYKRTTQTTGYQVQYSTS